MPLDCMEAIPNACDVCAAERDIARAVAAVAPNTPKTVERFQSFRHPTLHRSRAKMSCPAATAAMSSFPEMPPLALGDREDRRDDRTGRMLAPRRLVVVVERMRQRAVAVRSHKGRSLPAMAKQRRL